MKVNPINIAIAISIAGVLSSCECNNKDERKYDVMQLYGGWKARADETRAEVKRIENHYREYTSYTFDSTDLKSISTEYPYWEEVTAYVDESGLRKATLQSVMEKGLRREVLYFEDGALIFAKIMDGSKDSTAFLQGRAQQYFYEQNTLVLAIDENGETRDIEDNKVLMAGIDLMKESKQVNALITKRDIKY